MTRITTNAGSRSTAWSGERIGWLVARIGDFIELTKPRIVMLELVTVVVAAHLAAPRGIDAWVLWHTVLGAALVAASAGAFNQWLEAGDRRPHASHGDRVRFPPAGSRRGRSCCSDS